MKLDNQNLQIVIWGHQTTENTFHYIHLAYEKAFKHLGYKTNWFHDGMDVSGHDFSNSLFFTEGQVDRDIPIRNDCLYLLHNCYDDKYKPLFENKTAFRMQTYTDSVLQYNLLKMATCIYADVAGNCLYFPWGTDLLPHEIDANKKGVTFNRKSKFVYWVGTVGGERFGNIDQITPYWNACRENGLEFKHRMGYTVEENIKLIQESYQAPVIVGKWQSEVNYLPCRGPKNISYGQMIGTNSIRVAELFDNKIVYNPDPYKLFFDLKAKLEILNLEELYGLMDFVKAKHTYLSRIDTIFSFIESVTGGNSKR